MEKVFCNILMGHNMKEIGKTEGNMARALLGFLMEGHMKVITNMINKMVKEFLNRLKGIFMKVNG